MQNSKRNNDKPRMKAIKLIQQLMLLVATLFIFSAALTACSSDDSSNDSHNNMNVSQEYTMTVQAKKADLAATRALYIDGTTKKLEVKWDAGEVVKVVQNNEVIGQLTAAASNNATTTLSGTLDEAPKTDAQLYFYLHDTTRNYSSQNGTIEDISANHDFSCGTVVAGSFSVDGTKVTVPAGVSFDNTPQAIVKFTLFKYEDSQPLSTTELIISDDATQQNILKTFDHLNGTSTKDDLTVTSTSATNVFYVALSDISSMMLNLFVNTGSKSYTYTKADVTFANGKYYEVSVKMADVHGLFSVCGGKKVYFANSNTQFTKNNSTTNWVVEFAEHQYSMIGNNPGNSSLNGNGSLSSYPGTVDLLGWSTQTGPISHPTYYGVSNSTKNEDYEGYFSDWGDLFNTPWRTLSKDEWEWLLGPTSSPTPRTNCRVSSTIGGTENARWLKAKINSDKTPVKGLIIFPDVFSWNTTSMGDAPKTCNKKDDDYTHTLTAAQWTAVESAGAVFLPAGGRRQGKDVLSSGSAGYYWSSTSLDISGAYCIEFTTDNMISTQTRSRFEGLSVRLVRDAY